MRAEMFSLKFGPDALMSKHDDSPSHFIPYLFVVLQKTAPPVCFVLVIGPSCAGMGIPLLLGVCPITSQLYEHFNAAVVIVLWGVRDE